MLCVIAGEQMPNQAKGKRFVKIVRNAKTGRTKKISYGQAGKAKGGGDRIKPGTAKGDAYCARSWGQMQRSPSAARNPNSPLRLSRAKWKCSGKTSRK
jgi:hypothetical protein